LKETKICRRYVRIDSVFCPYCDFEDDVPDEFYEIKDENNFEIIHACDICRKQFKINGIKET
jgi:CRISPR/Cas system-associated protein Cas10 (large subunit of type III CRISPR-Cas system)